MLVQCSLPEESSMAALKPIAAHALGSLVVVVLSLLSLVREVKFGLGDDTKCPKTNTCRTKKIWIHIERGSDDCAVGKDEIHGREL